MGIRRRRILLACLSLLVPLGIVAASTAHVFRASAARSLPRIGGGQPAPSLFGIDSYTIDNVPAHFAADFPSAKKLHARWLHFTAGYIHWVNGRPNWAALDNGVTQARKRHMGVLISLGGASKSCAVGRLRSQPAHCPPSKDVRAYKSFLTTELLRYRKDVTYYESWTEPNHKPSWGNRKPSPRAYANLLRTQASVFRSVNRRHHLHLKLLFGGTNDFKSTPGVIPILPFVHAVLHALHGKRPFDGIALHGYVYPPSQGPSTRFRVDVRGIPAAKGSKGPYPAQGCHRKRACHMTWPELLSAYEQEFTNHGYGSEPLWLSEFGWTGNAHAHGRDFPSNAVQARNLRAAYRDLLHLSFVQAAFWFNLRDYKPGIPSCRSNSSTFCNPDPAFFGHYGLLTYSRSVKPAGRAFKKLARANPGR